MRKILLTQGKFALVDDNDFEELSKYKWQVFYRKDSDYWSMTCYRCDRCGWNRFDEVNDDKRWIK